MKNNIILILIILFLFVLIIFFIIKFKKKNKIENFCANIGEKCMINQTGKSNCCNEHYCTQVPGNFEYKVCQNKPNKIENIFNNSVINTINEIDELEDSIEKDFEDLTEEEQLLIELKGFCGSSNISVPNLFYNKNNKNKKNVNCDCSKLDKNTDDEFNLFSDIHIKNCGIFPV